MTETDVDPFRIVSVVIPAKNEAQRIASIVSAVPNQRPERTEMQVLVVDDGSTDDTVKVAREAGARVIRLDSSGGGNPARAHEWAVV